jgi:hypothetical protein
MALTGERFELGSRIGRGQSGEVHRAVDRLTGDTVAVKLVDLEDAEDEVEDIQREIATLAQIDSPFVTKYLGSWLCEGSTRPRDRHGVHGRRLGGGPGARPPAPRGGVRGGAARPAHGAGVPARRG